MTAISPALRLLVLGSVAIPRGCLLQPLAHITRLLSYERGMCFDISHYLLLSDLVLLLLVEVVCELECVQSQHAHIVGCSVEILL